jgi:hypothetical protein
MHHTRLFKTMAILAVCACVQGISGTVMADEAQNAAALEHAVLCGKDIHAIFDLLRCTEHGTSKRGGPGQHSSRRLYRPERPLGDPCI